MVSTAAMSNMELTYTASQDTGHLTFLGTESEIVAIMQKVCSQLGLGMITIGESVR
jgi:hypothetical protein